MLAKGLKVLVIGGGFSGMTAAIQLRKAGADVEIVEIDPGWRSYGAGITLGGATLRALREIGVLDEFLKRGDAADGVELFTAGGHKIASIPTPRLAGPDVPGAGAVMRPVLAAILAEATKAAGAKVRLGSTFTEIVDGPDNVRVTVQRRLAGELRSRDRRGRALFEDAEGDLPRRPHAPLHRTVRVARRCASHG